MAPIVGRADLLCGLLSMAALSLTITKTGGRGRGKLLFAAASDRAGKLPPGTAPELVGQDVAPVATACAVPETPIAPPPVAKGANHEAVSRGKAGKEGGNTTQRAKGRGRTVHGKGKAGKPPKSPSVATTAHPPPRRVGAIAVETEDDTGPGVARFLAALVFAVGATLCKEIGITLFGLMAGGEVVRFVEEHDRQQSRRRRQPRRPNVPTTDPRGEVLERKAVQPPWRRGFVMRAPVAAAARVASALTCAALLVVLHVRLREGAGVREWGVLENDISILARWALDRVLADLNSDCNVGTSPQSDSQATRLCRVGMHVYMYVLPLKHQES